MTEPRIHWLQHAEHEGLGCIGPWLERRGFATAATRWQRGDAAPRIEEFDWLIVMGGPMNIYEFGAHPWLRQEHQLIRDAFVNNKQILGICLGAQLLADALGGAVSSSGYQEIGFFDVSLSAEGTKSALFGQWPKRFEAFHWHGDTFALPPGSPPLMSSVACRNQAFEVDDGRLVGLQFHLEVRPEEAAQWLAEDPPKPGKFVQDRDEMLRLPQRFVQNNRLMLQLLDRMAERLGH